MSRVILFVDDIEKMSAFYQETFGLTALDGATSDFIGLDAGGCQLSLHQIPPKYLSQDPNYEARQDSYVKFVFRSDNVESDREELIEKGVRMKKMHRYESMEFCDGCDPEGNIFQISSRIS